LACVPKTSTDMVAAGVFRTTFAQPESVTLAVDRGEVRDQLAGRFPKIDAVLRRGGRTPGSTADCPREPGTLHGLRA
jgi:hypothetical protein